jgi:hypothetical protein
MGPSTVHRTKFWSTHVGRGSAGHGPGGGVCDDHLAISFYLSTNGLNCHVIPASFNGVCCFPAGGETSGPI